MKGKYARVIRKNPTPLQDGLYNISRIIFNLARYYYFYEQIRSDLIEGNLIEEDIYKVNVCLWSLERSIVIGLSKLVDKRKDAWSFEQLLNTLIKSTKDNQLVEEIRKAIGQFKEDVDGIRNYRNERGAHQKKEDDPTQIVIFANLNKPIKRAIQIGDMFVEDFIPYELSTLGGNEHIANLRVFLGL